MNDKNNSVIRGCLSTYFQGWSLKPHKEQIRLAKNYYNENGDIPEFMYAPAPTDAPNRFGFAVTEGGILITVNTYKTDIIMLIFNEDGSIDICPTETGMSSSLFLYPDAKRMLLNKPSTNMFFPYYKNISNEDFGERLYYYENGVFLPNKKEENEIDLWIYRDSVIVANLNGILCSSITFRRSPRFERCYELIIDASDNASTDFTVRTSDLEVGLSLPILADALKPQSMLIDRIQDMFFHRELIFIKNDINNVYTDYNIKNGISTLKDAQISLLML